MRVRWMLVMALVARPVLAAEAPVAFQQDGTYFHSVHAEVQARQAKADTTESPKAALVLGGGAVVGLAALFVSSATGSGGSPSPSGPNPTPLGGTSILLPPQDDPRSPSPTPGTSPYDAPRPGGTQEDDGTLDVPVTVAPEPVSMALLATGLAGLSGATIRRRLRRP